MCYNNTIKCQGVITVNNYPKKLDYGKWLEKYVHVLPKNIVLKVLWFPFYIVLIILSFASMGIFDMALAFVLMPPVYGIYSLTYNIKKNYRSQKTLLVSVDEKFEPTKLKIKDILTPNKNNFTFSGWKIENGTIENSLWKLSSGKKVVATWTEMKSYNKNMSNTENMYNFETLSLDELKNLAIKNNIKNILNFGKNDLINLLKEHYSYTKFILQKVSGVSIDSNGKQSKDSPRQLRIKKLSKNIALKLVPDKNNKYDSNAIIVTTQENEDLGYISKENNKEILDLINNKQIISVVVSQITGGSNKYYYGLVIQIKLVYSANIENIKLPVIKSTYRRSSYTSYYDYDNYVDYRDYYDPSDFYEPPQPDPEPVYYDHYDYYD